MTGLLVRIGNRFINLNHALWIAVHNQPQNTDIPLSVEVHFLDPNATQILCKEEAKALKVFLEKQCPDLLQ